MIFGILAGFLSAFLQSSSYVFSRRFVLKHGSPGLLVVYSQAAMGVFGAITLAATLPFVTVPLSLHFFLLLAALVAASNIGYFCFFRALREIEASRLSSLLGLKIVVLAVIAMLLPGRGLSWIQLLAVTLSAVAAVGMNFTGGPLSRKGILFLLLTLLSYASADIVETKMILMMPGERLFLNAITVTGVAFFAMGCVSSLAFFRMTRDRRYLADAVPYAVAWYLAMIFLFASFGTIGVLFGNMIQASRGIISVLLGVLLVKAGLDRLEPRVGASAWRRRVVMAVLMLAAMALYSAAP